MKKSILIALAISSMFLPRYAEAQDDCFEMWVNVKQKVCPQLVSNLDGYTPSTIDKSDFNRYGSYYKLKTDSTGFYYVKKIDGRWWLIDPDGYAGINMAVTTTIGIPAEKKIDAHFLLKDIGFNGIGNFVTPEKQTKDDYNAYVTEKMSYTRRSDSGGFFQRFRSVRRSVLKRPFLESSTKNTEDIITIFDSEFDTYCDTYAKEFQRYKDERELLGYFSDNEIYFGINQLQLFITELPDTDPNYIYAADFASKKDISLETIKKSYASIARTIKEEFAGLIAERYYKTVSAVIKKYDPNHLYLGSRLHGTMRGIAPVVKQSAKYCDVVSVNFYDRITPSAEITHPSQWGLWLGEFDKPAMVTEFYTKGYNTEYPKQPGAGYYVNNQTDRGYFYQNTCFDLLKSKFYIGWQYFRWQDDFKPNAAQDQKFSNKGIVDVDMNEYTEMTSSMRELNSQVYRIIEHLDSKANPAPKTETTLVPVSEATYVSYLDEGENFGSEQVLKVKSMENESVLKFNIPVIPKDIYDATIRFYVTTSSATGNKLLMTAISDQSWSESSLTGSVLSTETNWKSVDGRLQTYEKTIVSDSYIEYNVRNWLQLKAVKDEPVTFKLSELTENTSYEFASNNYRDASKRPQLIIKTIKSETGINNPNVSDIKVQFNNSQLSIEGITDQTHINIYSIAGLNVFNQTVASDQNIKLSLLPGIYIVKLNGNNINLSSKINIK